MKSRITLFFALLIILPIRAQTLNFDENGGEHGYSPEKTECLSNNQRQAVIKKLNLDIASLRQKNRLLFSEKNRGNHPLFIWPVQKEQNLPYNSVWAISNYVDHNLASPNQLLDYNCGARTYDTNSGYNHRGIDIFTWPFSWKLMDNDEAEIIAAAPGQIISKSDGNFDRSCDFNTSTPWNAVFVQHNDGSIAWYGHMKNGSTTTKGIGDTVVEGEYLGVVGSSGVSTGPHLHFEVWQDATYTHLIDPYSGNCNNLNTESWWQNQKPYSNPGINAVLTHSSHPDFNVCPASEVTNESNQFNLNEIVYFYLYLRDQYTGSGIDVKIIRPDGSYLLDTNSVAGNNFSASYWWWSRTVDTEGVWQWEATYEGQTVTHSFNVGTLSVEDEEFESISIFPNPFDAIININSETRITKAQVIDVSGKIILKLYNQSIDGIKQLNLSELSNGMYFVTLEGIENQKKTIKLIKK